MSNVVSFVPKAKEAPRSDYGTGAKTLFIHIKSTTLIAHLAAQPKVVAAGGLVGKS